jgi:hypothetical protein
MFGKNFLRQSFITAMPFLLFVFLLSAAQEARAINLYGVTTTNQLVRFDSATPANLTTVGAITGLQGGENILGIDFRPATGQLYGLGSTSRLYVINIANGAASPVGAGLSPALSGTDFGFDFNPTVDRIRIVSNTGQNLRVNPNDGSVTVDGALNPGAPQVSAAAYINNFNGATTTTLYDIDAGSDQLFTQNPPNSGTLVPVGALGVDIQSVNGFDFTSATNTAYLVATPTVGLGNPTLFTVNLTSGAATAIGAVGGIGNFTALRGLAVEIGSIPGLTVYGLTTTNNLVRFNSARPNTILSTVAITGLQGGENLIGIDFRPANGQLYAAGNTGRIYTINTTSGAATFVSQMSVAPVGTSFGFDFNPVPDRLRLVSDADQNLRINVTDGVTTGDGTLAYAAGDPNNGQNPNIVSAAYTNSFAGTTTTALRVIDSNLDIIATQDPPNNGTLTTVGSLGVDTTTNVGYDFAGAANVPVLTLQVGGDTVSKLFTVSGAGGFVRAAFIGTIGGTDPLRGVAVATGGGTAARDSLDFDGDGRSDFANFRISNSTWYIRSSITGGASVFQFGQGGSDILAPGDYDGDGRADAAVFRPSNGTWYVLRSSNNQLQVQQFGQNGDQPVQRDYDGDGRVDFAVVRRQGASLFWYILNSGNNGFRAEQFGLATDSVAPGDYDGDGRFDLAVKRGVSGQPAFFYIQQSTAGFVARQWGLGEDATVPGDYDGDGKTDLAVIREGSNWTWYILQSSDNALFAVQLGAKGQFAAQADYTGDGKTDVATFEPGGAAYYYRRSSDATWLVQPFGSSADVPVANYNTY